MSVYPEAKDKLHFKERRRQKGESQYQRQTPWHQESNRQVVTEGRAKVEVNLEDYLDTGLFLDHRPVRQMIAEQSRGKRFLNLFCYTAVATVQAALGGAKTSVSVDMSNTYLDWAKRNFELNAISTNNHQLVRADCLAWLDECKQTFDLIFLDPPTFSNSKKMDNVLDVQRDHGVMIDKAMRLLAAEGTLLFSTNFRRFKLDQALEEKYSIEDISEQSIPPDFQRNNRIHRCWVIRHSDS
jgi:23S rRNA (guanine2445-N2)-methyltransferase / 23S rRNA (guanine2069-N7)-methyltransferase